MILGAALDKDFMVHHVATENLDQLRPLRGSRYLQSRTENTFAQVKPC